MEASATRKKARKRRCRNCFECRKRRHDERKVYVEDGAGDMGPGALKELRGTK